MNTGHGDSSPTEAGGGSCSTAHAGDALTTSQARQIGAGSFAEVLLCEGAWEAATQLLLCSQQRRGR